MREIFNIGKHNVIFIVVDSCRYDSAEKAKTPFMCRLSPLRRAEAPATYTLPSHMSFFIGILPVLIDGNPEFFPGIRQIWRSVNARESDKSVAVVFHGKNILDFYQSNGYDVLGSGGVSFFGNSPNNILPQLFPRFIHFQKPANLPRIKNVPRNTEQFPLANMDRIMVNMDSSRPFFLFVNCPETHIPYDSPNVDVSKEYKTAIKKLYAIDNIKHCQVSSRDSLTKKERTLLMDAQVRSLEWVDQRVEELYIKTRNGHPTIIVVMSDHGDEFGEGGRYGHTHYHHSVMHVPLWCGVLS